MKQRWKRKYRAKLSDTEWSTSLYECLIPILRELGWYGSREQLNQVLPIETSKLSINETINSLAGMRIATEQKQIKLNKIDATMLPCIFADKRGAPMILLEFTEFGLSIFNGFTKKKNRF